MTIFLETLAISFLGLAFIVWFNSVKAGRGKFSFQIWVNENYWSISMSLVGILLATTINLSEPDALHIVKAITGLDLTATTTGWFTFAILLYSTVRKFEKPNKSKP